MFCAVCHIPMTFQRKVFYCEDYFQAELEDFGEEEYEVEEEEEENCFVITLDEITTRDLWHTYVVVVQVQ